VIDVLVVGAGPTGLALAAQVRAHGGRVRVVERRTTPQASRAFVVHPRTLEVLTTLGVADEVIARGAPAVRIRLHAKGRVVAARLTSARGAHTPYPYLLPVPQAAVEDVLEQRLLEAGIPVEHGVELTALRQDLHAVTCDLQAVAGHERAEARYVVGCDGADSTVRRQAGVAFPSRGYRPSLLLADLEIDGDLEPDALHGFVAGPGILFLFPSPTAASWRLLTVHPRNGGTGRPGPSVDLATLQALVDPFTGGTLRLHDPAWTSEIRLRRGQATRYRTGRVLLAGDAAHIHSPAGAQGMNTGIQDACNLGWKLALVTTGRASARLLDSYERERWPVARRTRQLTDLAFLAEADGHAVLRWLRHHVTPWLLPLVDGRSLPAPAFRLIGGLSTRYRASPAVEEGAPRLLRGPRAGDRMADGPVEVDGRPSRLLEVLAPPGFDLLLCGDGAVDHRVVVALQGDGGLPLRVHRLSRRPAPGDLRDPGGRLLRRLGVSGSGVYLVRPDGYVAYRSRGPGLDGVAAHLAAISSPG
jgi:2-polyprenyl-6-methoxyphenol hydroxylase-like FAD-dependent oxidoreductase